MINVFFRLKNYFSNLICPISIIFPLSHTNIIVWNIIFQSNKAYFRPTLMGGNWWAEVRLDWLADTYIHIPPRPSHDKPVPSRLLDFSHLVSLNPIQLLKHTYIHIYIFISLHTYITVYHLSPQCVVWCTLFVRFTVSVKLESFYFF